MKPFKNAIGVLGKNAHYIQKGSQKMDRNARHNRPKKKEKSEPQWDKEFGDIRRKYEFSGNKKDYPETS